MTTPVGLEVPPKNPPDWRDWVNEWPSVKSIAFFCFIAWIVTAIFIAGGSFWGYATDHEPKEGIIKVLEIWLDALNWLTAAAVFGVVGKFAATKPDVIRAEGEVQAKVIAAAAQAAAAGPDPDLDPTDRQ